MNAHNIKNKLSMAINEPYYFVKYYFILLLIQSLFFVEPKMQNLINYLFIMWGSIMMLNNFVLSKQYLKIKTLYVFFACWIFSIFTVFLNREAGNLIYSLKTIYLLSIVYFIFYTYFNLTKKSKNESLYSIVKPLVILQFIFAVLSILMFIFNISGYVLRPDEGFYFGVRYIFRNSGIINPLLAGIYNDPNYGVIINFSSILLSIFMINNKRTGKFFKGILYINILLEFYMLVLANSRAAYIGMVVCIIMILSLLAYNFIRNHKNELKHLYHIGAIIIMVLITLILGDFIRSESYKILQKPVTRVTLVLKNSKYDPKLKNSKLNFDKFNLIIKKVPLSDKYIGLYPKYFEHLGAHDDSIKLSIDNNNFEKISEDKEDTDTKDILQAGNGRVGRWYESLKLVTKHRPLTGTSSRGTKYFAAKYASESEPFRRLNEGQDPVNSLIRFLLHYGWISFILLLSFGLFVIVNIIKNIKKYEKVNYNYILIFGLVGYLLVISMFLSALLDVCSFYSATLAFLLGYLEFVKPQDEEKINE
ncbi:O-antigen ligase family protein [Helcococcus bovis]|uniref:O-antigen ligase family protein n=1 Tax=Helcococcus bovis TaxID=3153252 RepID=UPI0038B718D2